MRLAWSLLFCPFLTGCVAFAYPSYASTPELELHEAASDARAFRINHERRFFGHPIAGAIRQSCEVEDLPAADGIVKSQTQSGVQWIFWSLLWSDTYDNRFDLCLYRPGFEAIVVSSQPWWTKIWENQSKRVTWTPIRRLEDELSALEKIEGPRYGFARQTNNAVRQFLAEQYERLSHHPQCIDPEPFLAKAKNYRDKGEGE